MCVHRSRSLCARSTRSWFSGVPDLPQLHSGIYGDNLPARLHRLSGCTLMRNPVIERSAMAPYIAGTTATIADQSGSSFWCLSSGGDVEGLL